MQEQRWFKIVFEVRVIGDHCERLLFGNAQRLLLLAILGVNRGSIPSNHRACGVTERLTPEQKPTEGTVGAPQSHFALTRFNKTAERIPFFYQSK
jgi:hypothetical protein